MMMKPQRQQQQQLKTKQMQAINQILTLSLFIFYIITTSVIAQQQQQQQQEQINPFLGAPSSSSASSSNAKARYKQPAQRSAQGDEIFSASRQQQQAAAAAAAGRAEAPAATAETTATISSDQANGISIMIETLVNDPHPHHPSYSQSQSQSRTHHNRQVQPQQQSAISRANDGLVPNVAQSDSSSRVTAAIGRSKRSLAASADYHHAQRQQQQQPQPQTDRRPFVDCKRLAGLWEFIGDSYPALSDYLFSLALGHLEATARSSQRSPELSQTARQIGQLLAEADQLARERSIAQIATEQPNSGGLNNLQLLGVAGGRASGWLTRVVANPAYARIVHQHLLQQQQQQLNRANHRFSRPSANPKSALSLREQVSYGRVIHYPHELADQTSRTLDKLHSLGGHHAAAKQQPDLTNEIGADARIDSAPASESLESNQIPFQTEPEEDPRSRATSSAAENSKTNKQYVYGNVLLRPSQARAAGLADNGLVQPIDKLRKYSQEQAGGVAGTAIVASSLDKSLEATYGRVVVRPQYADEARHQELSTEESNRDQQSKQQRPLSISSSLIGQQSQGLGRGQQTDDHEQMMARTSGSLNNLKDQLEPSQFGFAPYGGKQENDQRQPVLPQQQSTTSGARGGGGGGGGGETDEMAAQENAASMAAVESPTSYGTAEGAQSSNPQSSDEFEGYWHSGPIEHVEASRQVRRESSGAQEDSYQHAGNGGKDDLVMRVTTSSPGQALVIS